MVLLVESLEQLAPLALTKPHHPQGLMATLTCHQVQDSLDQGTMEITSPLQEPDPTQASLDQELMEIPHPTLQLPEPEPAQA